MSYLLDALRKAERDRQRDRVPDIARLHDSASPARNPTLPVWVAPVVAVLVLLNLGALMVFWISRGGEEPSPPAVTAGSTAASAPSRSATSGSATSGPAPTSTAGDRVRDPAPSRPTAAAPATRAPSRAESSPDRPRGQSGQPLASMAELPADIRGRLPTLQVNGHLYSSIPGRSFILVNGRRYREGERLAEGPALVSIDERGAILDFEGRRFRIAAPR